MRAKGPKAEVDPEDAPGVFVAGGMSAFWDEGCVGNAAASSDFPLDESVLRSEASESSEAKSEAAASLPAPASSGARPSHAIGMEKHRKHRSHWEGFFSWSSTERSWVDTQLTRRPATFQMHPTLFTWTSKRCNFGMARRVLAPIGSGPPGSSSVSRSAPPAHLLLPPGRSRRRGRRNMRCV